MSLSRAITARMHERATRIPVENVWNVSIRNSLLRTCVAKYGRELHAYKRVGCITKRLLHIGTAQSQRVACRLRDVADANLRWKMCQYGLNLAGLNCPGYDRGARVARHPAFFYIYSSTQCVDEWPRLPMPSMPRYQAPCCPVLPRRPLVDPGGPLRLPPRAHCPSATTAVTFFSMRSNAARLFLRVVVVCANRHRSLPGIYLDVVGPIIETSPGCNVTVRVVQQCTFRM